MMDPDTVMSIGPEIRDVVERDLAPDKKEA